MAKSDAHFMRLALVEARKGMGRTSPNPCVGAVIVRDNEVIATGYHKKAGTPHAEIHALRTAGEGARGATMYVTLEPCSHTGKTPPCSHKVVESGIQRVVIGMLDPNPLVDGGGRKYLIDHKLEVTTGVLEKECRAINRAFIKFITTGKPLVALKAGVSLDGRLNYQKSTSGWITGAESREKVHQLRDQFDAILVGRRTIEADNPLLTTRLKDIEGIDPARVILDSHLTISSKVKILNLQSNASTLIFCSKSADKSRIQGIEKKGAKVIPVDTEENGLLNLTQVLDILAKNGITSLLVEGGGAVHSAFLQKQHADRAYFFYAPLIAGSNGDSLVTGLHVDDRNDAIKLRNVNYVRFGDDILIEGDIRYPC